jgi:MFS family permease
MSGSPTFISQSSTTTKTRRRPVVLYVVIVGLFWLSMYIYVPTLPTYVQGRSDNLAMVGMILAQYGLWQALVRLPIGISSDWLGRRKPFILIGIALTGIGAWLMGTADGTTGLAAGRAMTGLAAGSWVPLTVAFSSLFPAQDAIRSTAILTFSASVGQVIGTTFTGSLNKVGGYSLAFNIAVGVAALALLLAAFIREKPRPRKQPDLKETGQLLTRRDVLVPALIAALAQYINWAITFGFLPILAVQLGATDVTLSLLMSMHVGIVTVSSLVAAALVNRVGARRLVYFVLILMSAATGAAVLVSSLWMVFVIQLCLGIAQGLGYPIYMGLSIQEVEDAERTTAMGLNQSVYAIGMFAGPWLSGILADAMGIRPMFGVTAVGCFAGGMLLVRLLPIAKKSTA